MMTGERSPYPRRRVKTPCRSTRCAASSFSSGRSWFNEHGLMDRYVGFLPEHFALFRGSATVVDTREATSDDEIILRATW